MNKSSKNDVLLLAIKQSKRDTIKVNIINKSGISVCFIYVSLFLYMLGRAHVIFLL